jgi:ribonuclease HI
MSAKKEIVLYTDGACSGNPGPGGWAAILTWNGHSKELSGYDPDTTNNRMELLAVISGLKAIKDKSLPVRVVTDSKYVQHAFTQRWIDGWIKKGWVTASKEPVKNQDLWRELLALTKTLQVQWDWTKGHALDEMNNRCDELARAAIARRG